jgi:hypothetical protein
LTKAILITAAIEADPLRDVMTVDTPNAFVQTEIKDTKEKITMKIKGKLAEMLILLDEKRERFLGIGKWIKRYLCRSDQSALWNSPSITIILSKGENRS